MCKVCIGHPACFLPHLYSSHHVCFPDKLHILSIYNVTLLPSQMTEFRTNFLLVLPDAIQKNTGLEFTPKFEISTIDCYDVQTPPHIVLPSPICSRLADCRVLCRLCSQTNKSWHNPVDYFRLSPKLLDCASICIHPRVLQRFVRVWC